MGNWFKELIGIDEDDEDEDEFEEEVEVKSEKKFFGFGGQKEAAKEPAKAPSGFIRNNSASTAQAAPSAQKPAAPAAPVKRFTDQFKLVVIKPQGFEESPKLVDSLRAKKPVIINLEDLDTDVARKIFDFLSGATYALNGNVQKVANNIFVFSPENVDVTYTSGMRSPEAPIKSPWK